MKTILTLCLMILLKGLSAQTTYSTIAHGNWSNPGTWKDGLIPSSTIQNNNKVIITHNVVYNRSNDLDVKKGTLKIIEGSLTFPMTGTGSGRSVYVRWEGKLYVTSASLKIPLTNNTGSNLSGNFYNYGYLNLNGATLHVAQNFKSEDGEGIYVLSCIKVGENYQVNDGKEIYDRSCIEVGVQGSGNFKNNKGDIRAKLASILLRGSSGNFENDQVQSKIRRYQSATIAFSAIDVPGDLENNGQWDAPIDKYCVGEDIQGSRANDIDFTSPENCTVVNSTTCDCTGAMSSVQSSGYTSFQFEREMCVLPEICAMPVNYFFDSTINGTNIPWGDVNGNGMANGHVTIGGYNYTETEGRAIYDSPNPNGQMGTAKKGFVALATLKLSATNYAQDPSLLASVNTVNLWLAGKGKLSPSNMPTNNVAVSAAADAILQWIAVYRCPDRR